MHYPVVGERVWIGSCRKAFLVRSVDSIRGVVDLTDVSGAGTAAKNNISFQLLFPCHGHAKPGSEISPAQVYSILRSSDARLYGAAILIREMREAICGTLVRVAHSRSLVVEADRAIERWQALGHTDHLKRE